MSIDIKDKVFIQKKEKFCVSAKKILFNYILLAFRDI